MATSSAVSTGDVRPLIWRFRRHRGRLVVVLLVGAYFALLSALGGYWGWSRLMPVGDHGVSIPDFRDLTSAWDCARRGIAVLPVNPCAPVAHSVANWPRLWLLPYHLGLGQGSTIPLAVAGFVAFLAVAVMVLPAETGIVGGFIYGLALCSPAVMLGAYWGNIDLIVFVFVAAGTLLLHRGRPGLLAGAALILVASLLKLFPIVAASALLRQPRRLARCIALPVVACWAAYVGANYGYIVRAVRATAQSDSMSFGVRRLSEWIVSGVNTAVPTLAAGVNQHLTPRAWDVGVAVAVVAVIVALRRKIRSHLPFADRPTAQRDVNLFWVGGSIYAFSYAVFESWDYRLVFILLTIPQLLRWAASRRAVAVVSLLALLVAMWIDLMPPAVDSLTSTVLTPWNDLTRLAPFHEPLPAAVLAQFVAFVGVLAGLVATLPRVSLHLRAETSAE